jgi:hypothetical protein
MGFQSTELTPGMTKQIRVQDNPKSYHSTVNFRIVSPETPFLATAGA